MKPSKRILILGIVIELALAALGWFLVNQLRTGAVQPNGTVEEASTATLQTIGQVMGGLGGLLLIIYFVLRRKERAN